MAEDKERIAPEQILSPEQMEKAKKWIGDHQVESITCPICKTTKWALGNRLIHLGIFAGGDIIIGGFSYPQLYLSCQKCGCALFVNAVAAGMLPSEAESTSTKEADNAE